LEQPSQSIPHPHTPVKNDAPLFMHIGFPMVLSGILAAALRALPARERTRHLPPAARKQALVDRGLQALARGDDAQVTQLTQQLEREGLTDA
jgi:hypothetical protein